VEKWERSTVSVLENKAEYFNAYHFSEIDIRNGCKLKAKLRLIKGRQSVVRCKKIAVTESRLAIWEKGIDLLYTSLLTFF
jgi:hypothetical protein